jgi:GTPase Era involved in 16S rRNA processing
MNSRMLKVAIVGHTNTGKTSLMRTLMRDVEFGEVSDRPATTRHVEGATLLVNGQALIELYDTPGLEDSISLLDHLQAMAGNGRRVDGVDIINAFLASPQAHGRFAQEAKALRQVLASDVALYVIDARDRVLGKHRDELEILARCARPVVPVLNFVAHPDAQTAMWREHLSRANLHAVAEFDTVVLEGDSERRLLEKMRTLLDRHQPTLDALINDRQQQRDRTLRSSAGLIADLLIDAAALVITVPADDRAKAEATIDELKQRVRDREQRCVEQLLALHRFRLNDFQAPDFPLADGRWGADLFSPAAMKQFGIRTGGGAAAGALAGLTIDAMVGGASLGAGAAIGAAIGALLGSGQTHGRRIIDRLRGRNELRCDQSTLSLLMARQAALVRALARRGHASTSPIQISANAGSTPLSPSIEELLDEARLRPAWSRLNDPLRHDALTSQSRAGLHERLAHHVLPALQR